MHVGSSRKSPWAMAPYFAPNVSRIAGSATTAGRRRRLVRFVGMLGASVAVVLTTPGSIVPALADNGPSFDATANAYGVDLTVANETIPLGIVPEASGPVALAHLDSLGDSDALASFPYPGEIVASLPGLAGALTNGIPFPAYPFLVATGAGDSPKDIAAPGIAMHAESGRSAASSRAVFGEEGSGGTSAARVEMLSDNSVRSSASAKFGVDLLGALGLDAVQSSAKVTADPFTGELTREAHLSIGQITVGGLSLTLPTSTPGTVPVPIPIPGAPKIPPLDIPQLPVFFGGQTLAAPDLGFEDGTFTITLPLLGSAQKFAIPADTVLSALKALGIGVTYQAAQKTTTGVVAPVLTFDYTAPAPPKNKYASGPTHFYVAVGRSTASVTLRPVLPSANSGGFTGGGVIGGTTSSGSVSPASGGTSPMTSGPQSISEPPNQQAIVPGVGTVAGVLPGTGTATGSSPPVDAGSSPTGGTALGANPSKISAVNVADVSSADLSGLYLICIGIGASALAGALVLRVLGVRLLWD